MSQIFIGYSRHNQDIVKTLSQDLEELGHTVWYDRELSGGQIWWDQILEKIRQCDIFVLALAQEALDSHACKLEYTYASSLGKILLPVVVADGVSMNLLPPVLSKIQHMDYRVQDKKTAFTFVKTFQKLPLSKKLPDPLPAPPEVPISYLGNLNEQIETASTLNFQEQTALVFKLKERLREVESSDDALDLLRKFRKRDDLLAKVAGEIDSILADPKTMKTEEEVADKDMGEVFPSSKVQSAGTVDDVKHRIKRYLGLLFYKSTGTVDEVKRTEPTLPVRLINKFTTIIILAIHAGLGIFMAALISVIPRWRSSKYGSYYYPDEEMALAAIVVFTLILALFFWLRRQVKGALNGKPKSQKIFQKIFPRNYKPKTALRTMNRGFLIFILISAIALIGPLDKLV